MKIHGTAKGGALSKKDFGVAFGGGAAAFTPTDIDDLQAWWDFSDEDTITKVDDRISQVDDKSGNDHHLTQSTSSLKPLWEESIKNNLDIGNFTDSRLMKASWIALTQPNTIAGAVKMPISNTDQKNICDVYDNAEGGSGGGFANDDTQKLAIFSASNVKFTDIGFGNVWAYFCNIYGGSADLRMNGSSLVTGDSGTVDNNGMTVSNHRTSNTYGNILCGELIVYNQAVSGSDLSDLETYLSEKWDIS